MQTLNRSGIRNDSPGGSAVKNLPAMQQPQKTWVPSLGQEDLLEKEIETHSSVSVWRTPWTGEPGGLYTVHGVTKSQTQLGRLSTQHRQALVHSPSRKTCSVAWQNPRCPFRRPPPGWTPSSGNNSSLHFLPLHSPGEAGSWWTWPAAAESGSHMASKRLSEAALWR